MLAVWFDARFPRLSPQDYRGAFLHVVASMAFAQLGVGGMNAVAGARPLYVLTVFLCIGIPGLVYLLLSGLWFIKLAAGSVSGAVR